MPAPTPVAYATLSGSLPSKPYILGITPSSSTPHLILRHPAPELTIADAQSLQPVEVLKGGHAGNVTDVCSDAGSTWSSAKDGSIVRWDERSRRPGTVVKAFVRKPLPVTSLTVSERDYMVVGGTELVSSEAHIMFWDSRHPKEPVHIHSSTHSDDITHLSFLPPTSSYLSSSSSAPLPSKLLLSASTDGLVALSNPQENDEDEAVVAEENWGQSIAGAGAYVRKDKTLGIWARSDMDGLTNWTVGRGEDDDVQLQQVNDYATATFKENTFTPPTLGEKVAPIQSNYLIDAVPTLGLSKQGTPMTAIGSNDGDIVVLHESSSSFQPSAFFISGPGPRGHKDVVRSLHHDLSNEAIYTGSEDGVLSGWSLSAIPRLVCGDPEIDDDGGDGRESIASDDEEDSESEIETEESDEDEMDVDDEGEGRRYGPVIGGRNGDDRKEKRRQKRSQPY